MAGAIASDRCQQLVELLVTEAAGEARFRFVAQIDAAGLAPQFFGAHRGTPGCVSLGTVPKAGELRQVPVDGDLSAGGGGQVQFLDPGMDVLICF